MKSDLFIRKWRVVCGDLDVSDIDLQFHVKKTLKPEPNVCSLTLYNLSEQHRDELGSANAINVLIEAGYASDQKLSQIYLGPLRHATHQVDGPQIVTSIESADKQSELGSSRFSLSIGAGTKPSVVLNRVASRFGIAVGNAASAAAYLDANGFVLFPAATSFSGSAARAMTELCQSAGLEWSVQDGELQILPLGHSLDARPYVIDSDHGLRGSPTIDRDGVVALSTSMLYGLRPANRILLQSRFVKGLFRIEEAEYVGDTTGEDWTINMRCKAPKNAS